MRYLREIAAFLGDIGRSWTLILELTKKDFKVRYLGSYFGIAWAFVQPIVTILILWFVFQWGLRSQSSDEYPFILWLINGLIPWFFISESIISATKAVVESSYLVKKVVFKVSILPVIKILSAAIVHFVFIILALLVFWLYGHQFSLCNLQLLYFFFCALCLAMAFGWILSALMVFIRDVGQVVTILFQFGFWLTPIVWRLELIPAEYRILLQFQPVSLCCRRLSEFLALS